MKRRRAPKPLVPAKLRKLLARHEKWRLRECLNLLPSENFASPAVRQVLSSDLSNRYTSPEKFYMGTRYIDEIQAQTEELARQVFEAQYADVRPLSGHVADMVLLNALTKRGDKIMVMGEANGGYPGIAQAAYPRVYGLQVCEFPFDRRKFNIDTAQAAAVIERERPQLVLFGASLFLFPHPVSELSGICQRIGARVAYDGSHVLGLIAGGEFQAPFNEGASVLIGSTHKSFFGPQGGLILANDYVDELRTAIYPSVVDNAHWNRVAALQVALYEIKKFGKKYASQVVRNSKALAKALDEHGVNLLGKDMGFTKSHQVIVDVRDSEEGTRMARELEKANMIVDMGIRIGTSEETRRGMKEDDMGRIAELISRVWVDHESPGKVRRDVLRMRREFSSVQFC